MSRPALLGIGGHVVGTLNASDSDPHQALTFSVVATLPLLEPPLYVLRPVFARPMAWRLLDGFIAATMASLALMVWFGQGGVPTGV